MVFKKLLHTLKHSTKAAFDLMSVLFGVAIVGVLAAIAVAGFTLLLPWVEEEKQQQQLATISSAQEMFNLRYGTYAPLPWLLNQYDWWDEHGVQQFGISTVRISGDAADGCGYIGVRKTVGDATSQGCYVDEEWQQVFHVVHPDVIHMFHDDVVLQDPRGYGWPYIKVDPNFWVQSIAADWSDGIMGTTSGGFDLAGRADLNIFGCSLNGGLWESADYLPGKNYMVVAIAPSGKAFLTSNIYGGTIREVSDFSQAELNAIAGLVNIKENSSMFLQIGVPHSTCS